MDGSYRPRAALSEVAPRRTPPVSSAVPMADASPKLRPDLTATAVEVDGVAYVEVRDPRIGRSFRFYDFEYALALQLNGQPVADVVSWAVAAYGLQLTAAGVAGFADRLAELGFLEDTAAVVELGADDMVEESQPVSQVVNRAVTDLARLAPAVVRDDPSQGIPGWGPDV